MQTQQSRLDNKVNEIMQEASIPGLAIAFIDANGKIIPDQLGVTAINSTTPVNAKETIFGAASLSKVMFSYLVLKLVETTQDGTFALTTKLSEMLPFSEIDDFCKKYGLPGNKTVADEMWYQSLTVGMVLSHTTGIPNNGFRYDFVPGTEYGYSGVAMLLLQEALEKKFKMSIEELACKYIFTPCEMNHSSFQKKYHLALLKEEDKARHPNTIYLKYTKEGLAYEVIGAERDERISRLFQGVIAWNQLPPDLERDFNQPFEKINIEEMETKWLSTILTETAKLKQTVGPNPPIMAANSFFTTAEDYAKFIRAWIKDPIWRDAFTPLISMTTDEWAKSVGVPQEDLKKVAWGLGMGLQLDEQGNVIAAYHSGDMNEWRSWVAINLEDKKNPTAVVFFANSKHGHVLAEPILSENVKMSNALNYFSLKYGFAVKPEPGWQKKEEERMQHIGESYFMNPLKKDITTKKSALIVHSTFAPTTHSSGQKKDQNKNAPTFMPVKK